MKDSGLIFGGRSRSWGSALALPTSASITSVVTGFSHAAAMKVEVQSIVIDIEIIDPGVPQ